LNSGRVELLDHLRLQAQLLALERRTARGGRDTIDHAPGCHDDLANAVAGALVAVLGPSEPAMLTWLRWQAEELARRRGQAPLGMREYTIGGPLDPAEREARLWLIEEQERRLRARW
jgi:hypothetical protein